MPLVYQDPTVNLVLQDPLEPSVLLDNQDQTGKMEPQDLMDSQVPPVSRVQWDLQGLRVSLVLPVRLDLQVQMVYQDPTVNQDLTDSLVQQDLQVSRVCRVSQEVPVRQGLRARRANLELMEPSDRLVLQGRRVLVVVLGQLDKTGRQVLRVLQDNQVVLVP